jgi:hypothetical protein
MRVSSLVLLGALGSLGAGPARAQGAAKAEIPAACQPQLRGGRLVPLVVHATRRRLRVGRRAMASSRTPGFLPDGSHNKPGLVALRACLEQRGAPTVVLQLGRRVTTFQLGAMLRDARVAGCKGFELHVGGRQVGRYGFSAGQEQLSVEDMYLGPATAKRISYGALARSRKPPRVARVRLVLDYGRPVVAFVPGLKKLDGMQLRLTLHTGPY